MTLCVPKLGLCLQNSTPIGIFLMLLIYPREAEAQNSSMGGAQMITLDPPVLNLFSDESRKVTLIGPNITYGMYIAIHVQDTKKINVEDMEEMSNYTQPSYGNLASGASPGANTRYIRGPTFMCSAGHIGYNKLTITGISNHTFGPVEYTVIVRRRPWFLTTFFNVWLVVLAAFFNITSALGVSPKTILNTCKTHTKATLTGLFAQIIYQPLICVGILEAFGNRVPKEIGMGFLLVASSPGGNLAQVWNQLSGADADLDSTINTIASFTSVVSSPLWLLAFSHMYLKSWDATHNLVKYAAGFYSVPPVIIVICSLLCHFRPKIAALLQKYWAKPSKVILILGFLTFGLYDNRYVFHIKSMTVGVAGATQAWSALVFGAVMSCALRLPRPQLKTVTFDSCLVFGMLAFAISRYALPQPEGDLASVGCMVVMGVSQITVAVAVLVHTVYVRCKKRRRERKQNNCRLQQPGNDDKQINQNKELQELQELQEPLCLDQKTNNSL